VGTTWHYLLDEFLGLGKGEKVDHNLKDKIVALIKLGLSNVAISGHLGVSTQTVSRTLNDKKRWQQKEEPKIKVTDHFYLTIDETTISLRFGRSAKRWRIWVLVIYTGVTLDKKGRNQCTNRRTYLEVYPQGFQVDANLYQKRVEEFIKRNYIYNKGTVILGSTDGAESLKRVVQNLPNSVLILSKFHYRKNKRHMPNLKFQNYCLNNKEGIENWNHPLSLGYCAEGNISKIKSIFAFGNRIYSVTSFKNILASKGISVKVFEGEKKSK
jgi:outer membrane protein assembly factor BamB